MIHLYFYLYQLHTLNSKLCFLIDHKTHFFYWDDLYSYQKADEHLVMELFNDFYPAFEFYLLLKLDPHRLLHELPHHALHKNNLNNYSNIKLQTKHKNCILYLIIFLVLPIEFLLYEKVLHSPDCKPNNQVWKVFYLRNLYSRKINLWNKLNHIPLLAKWYLDLLPIFFCARMIYLLLL